MNEIPAQMIVNRMKVANFVPYVMELRQAFDYVTFERVLNSHFSTLEKDERKTVAEIIINISESWADTALEESGEIILKDEFTDMPYISADYPITVEDREKVRLNSQRIEWLRRWAEGCSENNDRISIREPYAFFTEQGQELVRKAISKGYMEETSNGYKWKLSNALLAYFSGRLISGDLVSHSNGAPHYVAGKEHYDDEGVNALFGTKNISQSRYQLIDGKGPKGYLKIDDLFV